MGEVVCTFVYSVFIGISAVVEAYQKAAKGLLNRIESVSQALINLWRFSAEKMVSFTVALVKKYEKKLVDMIYDPSSEDALGHSVWCSKLWDCLTFVSELMDPSSLLFRKMNEWWGSKCKNFVNADLLNDIRGLLADLQTFQQTVCSFGFTCEFGISMIKEILGSYRDILLGYADTMEEYIKKLKAMCLSYIDWITDCGLIDYLEKLDALGTCIIDSSETCSSIATAGNYYENMCSFFHIEKSGDTWGMNSAYKNAVYGEMEGNANQINNLTNEIDALCDSIVNPDEARKASNAFNLSKNLFPGGIEWSDITREDGWPSWNKMWSKKTWRKNTVYQKYNQSVDSICESWKHGREKGIDIKDIEANGYLLSEAEKEAVMASNDYLQNIATKDSLTLDDIMKNIIIDENGCIYYRDECDLIQLFTPILPYQTMEEYYSTEDGSDDVLLDGNEVISVTQAAIRISKNPESTFAKRCEKIWRTIHNWQLNSDTAKKYKEITL